MKIMTSSDVILTLLGLASLIIYARLARKVLHSSLANIPTDRLGFADVVAVGGLGLFFISMTVAGWNKPQVISTRAILVGCILYACIILCIIGLLIFRNINPLDLFGLRARGWPMMGVRVLGWLVVAYPLISFVQVIAYNFQFIDTAPQEIISYLINTPRWQDRLIVMVLAVIIAPVAEEFIFRGYFYGVLRKYTGRIIAATTSSFLFAVIHLHVPSLAGLFVLALALTLVYERMGTLWAPILMHSTFNAITVCLALSAR